MKYTTSYGKFYGRKPALEDLTDITILKSQKFSQLPCTKILNRRTKEALDNWQKIEKEGDYMGIVLSTLRSLNTYVMKCAPNNSTSRADFRRFKPAELTKVERYDKLIEKVSMKVKNQFNKTGPFKKNKIVVPKINIHKEKRRDLDTFGKDYSRKKFLKFIKGSINFGAYTPSYNNTLQRTFSKDQAKNFGNLFSVSDGAGALIPDTRLLTLQSAKTKSMNGSLLKLQEKMASTMQRYSPAKYQEKAEILSRYNKRRNLSVGV
mmetsp:Transcript_19970/g.17648  ORF Transcript_19970/g.17648 Transcript_19970/m.17648 type:complete len:263 (+) Transcript_19970:369-1157(+)